MQSDIIFCFLTNLFLCVLALVYAFMHDFIYAETYKSVPFVQNKSLSSENSVLRS